MAAKAVQAAERHPDPMRLASLLRGQTNDLEVSPAGVPFVMFPY